MIGLLLKILLTAVLFIILSFVIPGFKCNDMGSALKASFGFAIIFSFLCLIFQKIMIVVFSSIGPSMSIATLKLLILITSFIVSMISCYISFGICNRIISNFFIESNKTLIIVTIVYAISSIAMNAAFDAVFK